MADIPRAVSRLCWTGSLSAEEGFDGDITVKVPELIDDKTTDEEREFPGVSDLNEALAGGAGAELSSLTGKASSRSSRTALAFRLQGAGRSRIGDSQTTTSRRD